MTTEHVVRTFKPRRRRVSPARRALMDRLGERFVLDESGPTLDLSSIFERRAPVVVEIGFGYGDATVELAVADPDVDVIAVDVHTPGVAGVLDAIDRQGLANLRVVDGDAVVFLDRVAPGSLAGIRVFFPDPWPKVRQRHRRLIRPDTIGPLVDRLACGGVLHLATDIDDYAAQMREVCAGEPRLTPIPAPWRPSTRYELKGADAGRAPTDLAWARRDPELVQTH